MEKNKAAVLGYMFRLHSPVFRSCKILRGYYDILTSSSVKPSTIRTCQSGRIFCSPYRNKCLPLASEKFALASESNLSLATGLAS